MAAEQDVQLGACNVVVYWRVENNKKTSLELLTIAKNSSPRANSVLKKAESCKTPQNTLITSCLRTNLSASDFDFLDGFLRASNELNSPQDPNKLPNHELLSMIYCGPLMKK